VAKIGDGFSTNMKSLGQQMRSERAERGLCCANPQNPMKTNVGSYDGGARFVIGCGVMFMSVNGWGWWALLGLIPIITGACSFCPAYWILGIDTKAWEERFEAKHPQDHTPLPKP
jgi:hypothetical protein